MHRDDSTEVVVVAGRPILIVSCAPDGTCDGDALAAALGETGDIESVWLSVDGTPPDETLVASVPPDAAVISAAPMTDAVKQVDADDVVVRTVDRSTLLIARPPALLPRSIALAASGRTRCRPLDGLAGIRIVDLG